MNEIKKIGFDDIVKKCMYICVSFYIYFFQIDGLFCRLTGTCTGVKMNLFQKIYCRVI